MIQEVKIGMIFTSPVIQKFLVKGATPNGIPEGVTDIRIY